MLEDEQAVSEEQEDTGEEYASEGEPVEQEPVPTPSYVTAEALQEAMGGFSEQQQQQFEQFTQYLQQQIAAGTRPQQPAREEPKTPRLPAYQEWAQQDPRDFHQGLQKQFDHMQQQIVQGEQSRQELETRMQRDAEARQFYDHITAATSEAIRGSKTFSEDPELAKFLRQQVVAEVRSSGGEYRKVNIPRIAQGIEQLITSRADKKYQAKIGPAQPGTPAVPGGNATIKPGIGVKPPAKGAGSKPAARKGNINTVADFDREMETFFTNAANAMLEET